MDETTGQPKKITSTGPSTVPYQVVDVDTLGDLIGDDDGSSVDSVEICKRLDDAQDGTEFVAGVEEPSDAVEYNHKAGVVSEDDATAEDGVVGPIEASSAETIDLGADDPSVDSIAARKADLPVHDRTVVTNTDVEENSTKTETTVENNACLEVVGSGDGSSTDQSHKIMASRSELLTAESNPPSIIAKVSNTESVVPEDIANVKEVGEKVSATADEESYPDMVDDSKSADHKSKIPAPFEVQKVETATGASPSIDSAAAELSKNVVSEDNAKAEKEGTVDQKICIVDVDSGCILYEENEMPAPEELPCVDTAIGSDPSIDSTKNEQSTHVVPEGSAKAKEEGTIATTADLGISMLVDVDTGCAYVENEKSAPSELSDVEHSAVDQEDSVTVAVENNSAAPDNKEAPSTGSSPTSSESTEGGMTNFEDSSSSSGSSRTERNSNDVGPDEDSFFPPVSAPKDLTLSEQWTRLIKMTHTPILAVLHFFSSRSARHPERTIASILIFSLALVAIGFFTNFNIDVDEDILWTPVGSKPLQHAEWIARDSGFPTEDRLIVLFFHANGDNVLGLDQMNRVFGLVEMVRGMDGYDEVCADSTYMNTTTGEPVCEVVGVPRFWNNSAFTYTNSVSSDEDVMAALSAPTYPNSVPVVLNTIVGYAERNPETDVLVSALSYQLYIILPPTQKAKDWEVGVNQAILELDNQWANEPGNTFRVESQVDSSFAEEFTRTIVKDIPLVPVVFLIMSTFTSLVFTRRNKVYSRGLLGACAVVAVFLSIISGFGLLFCIGTPFTSMTQLLPFVIFGIGLDDAFIIMGSYSRTDLNKDPVERIADTIDDIGLSITLTTTTSASAFALGLISSIPSVDWLCMYAFPTIMFVFIYQLTFFVGCIVLDERRIAARRRDFLPWKIVDDADLTEGDEPGGHFTDRIMEWYAEKLLRPWVKMLVLIVFAALAMLSAFSASMFTQEFKFKDVLPKDSYLIDYFDAADVYSEKGYLRAGVYFRGVNQSDPNVQAEMQAYLDDLADMDQISRGPDYFWLRHLQEFTNATDTGSLPFNDQVALFLTFPLARDIYARDIVLDSEGNVIASRAFLYIDNVDLDDVNDQVGTLEAQRELTRAQPVNAGKSDFCFFLYESLFNIWEFYLVSVGELVLTTVVGVVAMTAVAMLFIPHWSAAVFVMPLICILYVDLLGLMQAAGIHINAVSYVTLAMGIGLLVDFILHVLFRFYELPGNRREKTVGMLKTMGASILLGGVTTFLGTIPLAFSSSDIFYTVYIGFLGIVLLGMSHGLILVPVILSTIGPECQISMAASKSKLPFDKERFIVC